MTLGRPEPETPAPLIVGATREPECTDERQKSGYVLLMNIPYSNGMDQCNVVMSSHEYLPHLSGHGYLAVLSLSPLTQA